MESFLNSKCWMPVPLGLWRLHKEELETFPGLSVMSFDVVEKEQQVFP